MVRNETLKRILSTTLTLTIILSFAMIFSQCNDDDDVEEAGTLAGTYTMQEVIVVQDYLIGDQVIIPSGTDITQAAAGGILSVAPCDDLANGAVELRENGQLFLVCVGETNEVQAGTWEENSSLTTLTLTLSSPPFASNLALTVNEINYTDQTIEGIINPLILTPDTMEDFIPEGVTPPQVILLAVGITFQKVEQ